MKKSAITLLLLMSFIGFSQTKGITYQAVILNPNGEELPGVNNTDESPLVNKNICLRFSILDHNSDFEYVETIQTTTDEYGMVNLIIGTGNPIGGYATSFSSILWEAKAKRLKVDLSTTGICSTYTEISNQAFTSVPFALYAQNATVADKSITINKLADGAVTDPKVAYGINKSKVGLGNVDNTSDLNKPISTATQTALNLKEEVANKSQNVITDANATNKYPSVKAIKVYVDGKSSDIQSELDITQTATGLHANGTYVANASSNYIQTATSLIEADTKLDAQIRSEAVTNQLNLDKKLDKQLTKAETIATSGSNTLSITGLQEEDVSSTRNQLLSVSNSGQIRKTATQNLFKEYVKDIIATDGQTQFTTSLAIVDINKINVYRNGIRISLKKIDTNTIALESGVVCYANDEIKIIQFN